MKKSILLAICLAGLSLSSFADASKYQSSYVSGYGLNSGNHSYGLNGYSYGSGSSYGSTHDVRPYTRRDGTYVEGHRAGNPGSGVHCRNNVCY